MLAFAPLLALTASSFARQDPAPPELYALPPVVVKTEPDLDDQRTCVATVKLEPGRTYGFWLNSQEFGNFKDRDGR
jgi:hypothetical protein